MGKWVPKSRPLTEEEKILYQYNESAKTIICTECRAEVKLGKGGIENYETQHKGSSKCNTSKEALLKPKPTAKKKEKPKFASLLSFVMPRAQLVPSLASNAPPVASSSLLLSSPASIEIETATAARQPRCELAQELQLLADGLEESVPEATESDAIAQLVRNPQNLFGEDITGEDLWEEGLNGLLKGVFGWGDDAPAKVALAIRRGEHGISGLVWLTEYFVVERGVDESMFRGKLTMLIEELKRHQRNDNTLPTVQSTTLQAVPPVSAATDAPATSTHSAGLARAPSPVVADHELEVVAYIPAKKQFPCSGLKLETPDGKTAHSTYPFALHDKLVMPWDYASRRGVVYLTSHDCGGWVREADKPCRHCASLAQNATLRNIIDRMNNGAHKNATYAYRGHSELVAAIQHQIQQNQYLRFRALNQTRMILRKSTALSNMNRLIIAVGSQNIARVDQIIKVGLSQKRGIVGILEQVMAAARGAYKVRSFGEQERLLATLLWRIGGDRVGHIVHRALGLPAVSTLRSGSARMPITPFAGKPTIEITTKNLLAVLGSIVELLKGVSVVHAVLMFDELACEKRLRWNPRTNEIVGLCRQHSGKVALELNTTEDLDEVFGAVDRGEVHCAADVTVGAVGILCKDHRLSAARPFFLSCDCKRESGHEHAKNVVQVALDGSNACKDKTNMRYVSIASDGETRRGAAFVELTFKRTLPSTSPVYPLLSPLPLLNLHVGDDDLTCDKDWKHVIKRIRNLLLRDRGIRIEDFRITPSILRAHLELQPDAKREHINAVLNPNDLQDVKLAFNLLRDIWTLPPIPQGTTPNDTPSPGFQEGREALQILGKLFRHITLAYLGVDLSLSEQLQHLSAAAHLAFVLYKKAGSSFIPTQLFIDIILMIKNVFFCVAKAKVDNPHSEFFIIQLGTDRLEIHFGILRTVVGNDCNLDILQMSERAGGVVDIADILAHHPEWDQGPKRIQLPALSRDAEPIPDSADHLSPKYLKGDYLVNNVTLQTCWRVGRRLAEADYAPAAEILKKAEETHGVDLLSPNGTLLVTAPLASDDVDESTEAFANNGTACDSSTPELQGTLEDAQNRVEIEDELADVDAQLTDPDTSMGVTSAVERTLLVDGKPMSKAKLLAHYGRYRRTVSSTDRLKRVQEIARYITMDSETCSKYDDDNQLLLIHDPILTLVHSDQRIWLAIGEVNGIRYNSQSLQRVGQSLLREAALKISFQLLGLRSATLEDDPQQDHDWRTYTMPGESITVPARFIEPMDAVIGTAGTKPYYLLQSPFLIAQTSLLLQRLSSADLKLLPKVKRTIEYPYREQWGKACFLAQMEDEEELTITDPSSCSRCTPAVTIDIAPQRVLEHMGAHILHDSTLDRTEMPCGACLRPAQSCKYYVVKGKGSKASYRVDWTRTTSCERPVNFSYKWASEYSDSSPCTNVPLKCRLCPDSEPAVWRYNFEHHLRTVHTAEAAARYEPDWRLSEDEMLGMKQIWKMRHKTKVSKKKATALLTISEAHQSTAPILSGGAQKEHPDGVVATGTEDSKESSDSMPENEPEDEIAHQQWGLDEVPLWSDEPDLEPIGRANTTGEGQNAASDVPGGGGSQASASVADSIAIGAAAAEEVSAASTSIGDPDVAEMVRASTADSPEAQPENEGRGLRPRKRKRNILNDCSCGEVASPQDASRPTVQCKKKGCETVWFHKECAAEEDWSPQSERNWQCQSCRPQAGKRRR